MDIQALITLIISIISMIMELIGGGPKPPVGRLETEFPSFARVTCSAPQWNDNGSSDLYTAGTMVKECTVTLDMVTISGEPVIGRWNRFIRNQIETNTTTGPTTTLDRDTSVERVGYDSTIVVSSGGQDITVRGAVDLSSDMAQFLASRFNSTVLPKSGNASFLKTLQTKTEVRALAAENTYHVTFSTYSKVLRPWFANAATFRPMLLDKQRARMEEAVNRTLIELLVNL